LGADNGRTGVSAEFGAGAISTANAGGLHVRPGFPLSIPGITSNAAGYHYQPAPAVVGGRLYINGVDGWLHVLTPTGAQVWASPTTTVASVDVGPPTVSGDRVFAVAGSRLYAFSISGHALEWSQPLAKTVGDWPDASPLVVGDDVYLQTRDIVNRFSVAGAP